MPTARCRPQTHPLRTVNLSPSASHNHRLINQAPITYESAAACLQSSLPAPITHESAASCLLYLRRLPLVTSFILLAVAASFHRYYLTSQVNLIVTEGLSEMEQSIVWNAVKYARSSTTRM
ncbi:hypothetical protein WN943_019170 [Citrus x changshan-huyou]